MRIIVFVFWYFRIHRQATDKERERKNGPNEILKVSSELMKHINLRPRRMCWSTDAFRRHSKELRGRPQSIHKSTHDARRTHFCAIRMNQPVIINQTQKRTKLNFSGHFETSLCCVNACMRTHNGTHFGYGTKWNNNLCICVWFECVRTQLESFDNSSLDGRRKTKLWKGKEAIIVNLLPFIAIHLITYCIGEIDWCASTANTSCDNMHTWLAWTKLFRRRWKIQ